MRIGKLRVNPQFVKQLIRPLVPVGILELMARRRYTPKSRRSAPRGTDDVPTPSAAHEYLSDHHQPTAVILYWSHHFGAVEALASFFKNALASLDVDVTMINIASDAELDAYALSGSGADFAIAVGSLPLAKRVLGRPLYEVFGEYFYFWPQDCLIYELQRVWPAQQYLKAARSSSRLRFLFFDRDYARLAAELTSPDQVQYFPFAGNFDMLPSLADGEARISRLAVIGTVGSELVHLDANNLHQLATAGDTPDLSTSRRHRFLEAIEATGGKTNTALVANEVLGIEAARLLSPEWLPFLTRIDAFEKQRRRLLVATALRGIAVDFYGTGWKEHVADCESFRFHGAVPYGDLSRLSRLHAGLVNFDPNLDDGLHDRVYTAMGNGCRVITNTNRAIAEINAPGGAIYTYDANAPDIADHASAALSGPAIPDHEVLAFRRANSWPARVDAAFA